MTNRLLFLLIFILLLLTAFNLPARADSGLRERALAIGALASSELTSTLKKELVAAMKQGGVPAALGLCAKKAQAITVEINKQYSTNGIMVRRTSDRFRNPLNKPDELDMKLLEEYGVDLDRGDKLMPRLETTKNGYRYVAPLTVAGLCLRCHGPVDKIDAQALNILKERYPNDKAVDYKNGDLRGLVVVDIPLSALKK